MGANLDLYVEDQSIDSPFLSSSFVDEIIFEWYIKFIDFLSEDEHKIISPNIYGEIVLGKKREATIFEKAKIPLLLNKAIKGKVSVEAINKLRDKLVHRSEKIEDRERDPERLKEVFQKVQDYLIKNSSMLPLVHLVYKTQELRDEIGYVMIDKVAGRIEGDLYHHADYTRIRNQIHLKSYLEDSGKIDLFVEVQPKIEIDKISYYTKSITKAEQFEEDFQACYDFLDKAIKEHKNVLWEFG